ncbi:polyphosphate polymerase domain-containing protein [Marinicella sediminis]|uniref:Polyphosphate polymerase domain-containing protein n=1 Tax=Marinicella sediminis TaxID=1792834 RepID=A0ABV7JA65_9GAMM|nr:polyphosphate polymerase domain-containing protein [Marinicella sediminis]
MDAIKEHFLRYEFKYILNDELRDQVEDELNHFMQLDPFVVGRPDHKYLVRSLYFDDPHYSFYYEKTDGLMHRQKFRIRTYTDQYQSDVPIMLELKGRYNNFVYKHRTVINHDAGSKDDVFALTEQIANKDNNPVYEQFIYDQFRKQIKPVMLIDYQRRAYQSKFDYEFRITFDGELYGTETTRLFPDTAVKRRKLIDGFTIMEVKFRKHVPPWFHRIMIKYQLKRLSISKYCTGMESTQLIEDLED